MKTKLLNIFLVFVMLLTLFLGSAGTAQAQNRVNVYLFYGNGCPHCEKEIEFLDQLVKESKNITVVKFEVWYNKKNQKLLADIATTVDIKTGAVPVTLIDNSVIYGFGAEETTGMTIKNAIEKYKVQEYHDPIKEIVISHYPEIQETLNKPPVDEELLPIPSEEPPEEQPNPEENEKPAPKVEEEAESTPSFALTEKEIPETINLPFVGEVAVSNFSLPLLTIVIGALDGFNPCAMWVLLFLISLLLGMENKKRMWILGSVFVLASGAVYFLFMAAWLNVFLLLGFIFWVRLIIALVAIGSGIYHLNEFRKNSQECKVMKSEKRQKTFEKLRQITSNKKFLVALGGMIMLAAAVNMVELLCSAGLPAVYTQVLTLSEVPTWQYYLYLLLYIVFFMLDDLIVFILAMATLKNVALGNKYSRYASLIGGVIILIIGILLIFKPGWLMFG